MLRKATMKHDLYQLFENAVNKKHAEISNFQITQVQGSQLELETISIQCLMPSVLGSTSASKYKESYCSGESEIMVSIYIGHLKSKVTVIKNTPASI